MALRNRVTPFGDIIATPARGMLTGNRGIIHDPELRQLLPNRRWSSKAWIYCLCDFQNRKRDVFGYNGRNGSAGWTNLFFLDEATALAAGHRPCSRLLPRCQGPGALRIEEWPRRCVDAVWLP